ncbi:unnamed protein product [Coffea canephora]|uniref:NAC domain-containing protein n=1 Tax=Coffea canephora TaxID=49390 RepID=A0A068UNM0_COFCA|nr:unnamed protein product [Coffea canephora]
MNTFSHVPPGFRFHPTDEELVDYYLRKKIASKRIDLDVIKDVDLYRIEPWDLQELCKIGTEEQNEWYFFSHKDKKYPTGTRTNRATKAGFWKATGRDKAIYSKHSLIGMRKTLVFYKGRAPNGQKSDWIMHEYRLETNENGTPQAKGWVVCRVFKKRLTTVRKEGDLESLCWYDDQVSFMPEFDSPRRIPQSYSSYNPQYSCKQEFELQNNIPQDVFLQLPQLESPKVPQSITNVSCIYINNTDQGVEQVTDWRVLDKFVASQLSHEDAAKQTAYSDGPSSLQVAEHMNMLVNDESKQQEMTSPEFGCVSAPSPQVIFGSKNMLI